MDDDAPIRTMKLKRPIYDGEEISELEFYEPTALLMKKLEIARAQNEVATKPSQFRAQSFVVLAFVTRVHESALEKMLFVDFQAATTIALEVSGLADDDDDEGAAPGKS